MGQDEKNCCEDRSDGRNGGILSGILYGLIPHSFCIAFILFSIVGAVTATAFLKKILLIPDFFYFLIAVSLLLATISAVIYLKRNKCLCASGIKSRWKYVATLYSTTTLINLLMFFIILPTLANMNLQKAPNKGNNLSEMSISVQIPCSGHAPLIIDEIKKNLNVRYVKFELPNTFQIKYDPRDVSPEKIASLEIFKTYPATIN